MALEANAASSHSNHAGSCGRRAAAHFSSAQVINGAGAATPKYEISAARICYIASAAFVLRVEPINMPISPQGRCSRVVR